MPDQCDQTRVPKSRWAPKTLEKAKLVKKIRRKYELTKEGENASKPIETFHDRNDFETATASCSITTGRFKRNVFETAHEMRGAFMPLIMPFRFVSCIGVETVKRPLKDAGDTGVSNRFTP